MRRNCLWSSAILIWCLTFLSSCNKNISNPPEIRFILPTSSTILGTNHILQVEIDIWDDILIDDYEIDLISHSGLKLYHDELIVNKESHKIEYEFNLSSSLASEYEIILTVQDSDGNKSTSRREISSK